jgi:PAS domain S-box-containing protein
MPLIRRHWVSRYGGALLAVAAAVLVLQWASPYLGDGGFSVMFVAVIVAAWYGGLGPSLLALALSLLGAMLVPGPPSKTPDPPASVITGISVFFLVGITTALSSESMRAARRRAEEAADEAIRQREQLRTTLACIGDAVIVTDREGRLTMMNRVAEALTGWTAADAVGQPLESAFHITNEHSGQPVENPVRRALREGAIVGLANHTQLTAKDGSRRPIDDSAAPIVGPQGEIVGVVLIFRDVTQRRRDEQALVDADRRKDEFLATLAHELRNPLAPVRMAVEILRAPASDAALHARAREILDRQVDHLVRLVDDLLDLSRITRGKIDLRPEPVELGEIAARGVEIAKPLLDARGHELSVSLPETPIVLFADPLRLAQVVGNLLTNAAKYTESGGRIWITGAREGGEAVLRVRDTGIGIPAELLPRVFDLFMQAAPPGAAVQSGLGIGLSLVKKLVEISGGSVTAHSAGLGHGSEFVVRLPIQTATQPVSPPQDDESRPRPVLPRTVPPRRVLVVDDNTDAAETLATLLRLDGHETRVCHDGPTALDAAAQFAPEVVFLDIGMPEMDGIEVARRLRQSPGNGVLLVAVTGWGQPSDRLRTSEAGFNHHLVKPVEGAAVRRLLAEASPGLGVL